MHLQLLIKWVIWKTLLWNSLHKCCNKSDAEILCVTHSYWCFVRQWPIGVYDIIITKLIQVVSILMTLAPEITQCNPCLNLLQPSPTNQIQFLFIRFYVFFFSLHYSCLASGCLPCNTVIIEFIYSCLCNESALWEVIMTSANNENYSNLQQTNYNGKSTTSKQ